MRSVGCDPICPWTNSKKMPNYFEQKTVPLSAQRLKKSVHVFTSNRIAYFICPIISIQFSFLFTVFFFLLLSSDVQKFLSLKCGRTEWNHHFQYNTIQNGYVTFSSDIFFCSHFVFNVSRACSRHVFNAFWRCVCQQCSDVFACTSVQNSHLKNRKTNLTAKTLLFFFPESYEKRSQRGFFVVRSDFLFISVCVLFIHWMKFSP